MGSSTSSPTPSIDWLLTESTRLLNLAAFFVRATSMNVTTYATSLRERAEAQITMVFGDIEEILTQLAMHVEQAQHCIAAKKPELNRLRDDLIAQLTICYQSQDRIFQRLQNERSALHHEALGLQRDAEEMVSSCAGELDTRFTCLRQSILSLSKKMKTLINKIEAHSKREFSDRRKIILQLMNCDRTVIDRAYKEIQTIAADIKKCIYENRPMDPPNIFPNDRPYDQPCDQPYDQLPNHPMAPMPYPAEQEKKK